MSLMDSFIFVLSDLYFFSFLVIFMVTGSFIESSSRSVVSTFTYYFKFLCLLCYYFFVSFQLFPMSKVVLFFNGLVMVSSFVLFFKLLMLFLCILMVFLSSQYMLSSFYYIYEFYVLLAFSLLRMVLLVVANDLLLMYLSIELMSLSFYVLSSSISSSEFSTEAGLKYFILGALSSGFLLFGFSLLYRFLGTTSGLDIYMVFNRSVFSSLGIMLGFVLVLVALFFKLAMVPFHVWVPDVYEGSPMLITAYFSIVPKVVVFCVLIKLFFFLIGDSFYYLELMFCLSSFLSIFIGSVGAFNQSKIKSLFSYSAMGHGGYILLGLLLNSYFGVCMLMVYLLTYLIMVICLFVVLLSLKKKLSGYSVYYVVELVGLNLSYMVLGWSLIFCLMSMAGIPPLVGFLRKFLMFYHLIRKGWYFYSVVVILLSVMRVIYYISLVSYMVFKDLKVFMYKSFMDILDPYLVLDLSSSLLLGSSLWLILSLMFFSSLVMEVPLYLVFYF